MNQQLIDAVIDNMEAEIEKINGLWPPREDDDSPIGELNRSIATHLTGIIKGYQDAIWRHSDKWILSAVLNGIDDKSAKLIKIEDDGKGIHSAFATIELTTYGVMRTIVGAALSADQ